MDSITGRGKDTKTKGKEKRDVAAGARHCWSSLENVGSSSTMSDLHRCRRRIEDKAERASQKREEERIWG